MRFNAAFLPPQILFHVGCSSPDAQPIACHSPRMGPSTARAASPVPPVTHCPGSPLTPLRRAWCVAVASSSLSKMSAAEALKVRPPAPCLESSAAPCGPDVALRLCTARSPAPVRAGGARLVQRRRTTCALQTCEPARPCALAGCGHAGPADRTQASGGDAAGQEHHPRRPARQRQGHAGAARR